MLRYFEGLLSSGSTGSLSLFGAGLGQRDAIQSIAHAPTRWR